MSHSTDVSANAERALAAMEKGRTYAEGEEPEVCRGPKPVSQHGYLYMGNMTWIRGDVPTERWKELLDSLRPKVQVGPAGA